MPTRAACAADIESMVRLSAAKRAAYARHQPLFWRMAPGADASHSSYFRTLLGQDSTVALVHENHHRHIDGFVIALLRPPPPVYDPGGLTCIIDDFCVQEPELWESVGRTLLQDVATEAQARGATQVVVVCGHHDAPKHALLHGACLSIASDWYVGAVDSILSHRS